MYIASELGFGYKHKCPVILSGANSFAISQSWFTNNQNICKLCKCHCCFFLSRGYFLFVPSHSWLIVTIQSGQFTLNSPYVIRVSSTVILNILSDISYACILLMHVTYDALSLATTKLKDLRISHNLKVQVCFHVLWLAFYSMTLFLSGENADTQIEKKPWLLSEVFQFDYGKTILVVKCASFVVKMWCLENGYGILPVRMTDYSSMPLSLHSPLSHFTFV